MANGSYSNHRRLERELAAFYEMRDAIVFSTGYQANLGLLAGLTGPNDVVMLDADCHASIYDGCKLAGAEVIRFRHNNVDDLAKRMRRLGARAADTLIVIEGIYSMLGDRAPLEEIVAVKREFGGYLLVDEAHSLGVLGERGRGLVEEAGVLADADFIVGTFSKSLGGAGGFCVSDLPALDLIRYSSRPYIFTASPSPATIASTRQALVKLAAGRDLRAKLTANYRRLHSELAAMGYTLGAPASPVIAVVLNDRLEALQFWKSLVQHGVYVNLMLPPATPNGVSLIRCSVSAAHSEEQIAAVSAAFAELSRRRASYPRSSARRHEACGSMNRRRFCGAR
jgi:8-amino-7-oxononanoate synthase